jgi:hypothetical protein
MAKRVLVGLGLIVAIYLAVRGLAESFLIDVNDITVRSAIPVPPDRRPDATRCRASAGEARLI